jgi:hypothetical protein
MEKELHDESETEMKQERNMSVLETYSETILATSFLQINDGQIVLVKMMKTESQMYL